jgi:hypothetical protein
MGAGDLIVIKKARIQSSSAKRRAKWCFKMALLTHPER